MSGSSGGGSSGGDFYAVTGSCSALVVDTQLSSPREDVVGRIQVGDFLDVVTQTVGATTVVVVLHDGQVAGGLASPSLQRLRECLEAGNRYRAEVTAKNLGQVRVRVAAG